MKINKRKGIIGLLITLICIGVFGYFGYDTMDDIKLGLDLAGGVHHLSGSRGKSIF